MGASSIFRWVVGLAVLTTGPAQAVQAGDNSAAAGVEQAKSSAKDTSRRVCRNLVASGTRLSARSCRTQADWDKDAENARIFLEKGQLSGSARDGAANGTLSGGTPR
jgi:hypothetical protein